MTRSRDEADGAGDPVMGERWEEIDRLFAAALELSPENRDAFLIEACGGDDALLQNLRGLLAGADRDGDDLLRPGDALVRAAWSERQADPALAEGTLLGRYRIVRQVGRGGMATVLEAERADGVFEQRVAIKLLHRGLDTDQLVQRFLAERQILSTLEHPNIARLIDGGASPDGRPYLVMELVAGEPIDRWADSRRLTIRERLKLFLQLADAVQFAHRRLIVHRDLKPSNILVDETGNARLLDFGIAKLLDPERADDTLTRTGIRPLTPAFASPEQVRGEPVTTASDVYQLGLLLYLLLCGRNPFTAQGSALESAITTGRIARPSAAGEATPTVDSSAAVPAIADARRTTPDGLHRALRGDLDAIVLKALRTEPDRRYASAADLAEDVERYLAGQPVLARPDSWHYRARKFTTRHPALTAAGIVGLLFAGTWVATVSRYANRLERERDRAQVESETAGQVAAFLVELFRANDPNATAGQTPTVFELLERGEQRAEALDAQPLVQSEMLDVIAQMYVELGDLGRAEPLFRRALEMRRTLYVEPSAELAGTLDRLGNLLERRGSYAEAEPLLREAIDVARLAPDSSLESDAHTDLGHTLIARGDYSGAEASYRRALEIRRDIFGDAHERTAIGMHNLALALEELERHDEAETLYLESLETKRRILDPEHSEIAITLTTLGRLYAVQGELDRSQPLLREAVDIYRNRLGPTHPRVALPLSELGTLYARRRKFDSAEVMLREALAINEANLGPSHRAVATGLNNISYVMIEQGRLEEALPLRRRVVEIARASIGDSHENTGAFTHNLADVLDRLGDHAEAEVHFREALRIFEHAWPDGHPLTTRSMVSLGDLLRRTGRPDEAEPLLRTALASRIAAQESATSIAQVEGVLGATLAALGQRAEAEELLVRSHGTLQQELGPEAAATRAAEARLVSLRGEG